MSALIEDVSSHSDQGRFWRGAALVMRHRAHHFSIRRITLPFRDSHASEAGFAESVSCPRVYLSLLTTIPTLANMSLQGLISGSECAVPFNPLSQVLKHTEGDRSIQQVC